MDNYSISGNKIHIEYEIEFILQTFLDSEFIWRVQACARVKFTISGPDSVDWFVFDAEDHDFFEEYEKYKEFVHVEKITYTDVECDTFIAVFYTGLGASLSLAGILFGKNWRTSNAAK